MKEWWPELVSSYAIELGEDVLLFYPVELVLPTHGEPTDHAALERALG